MVKRARQQAGNLAHAVNTPLTVLLNAASTESSPLATLVREQADVARRQVDHHLAQARAAAAVHATGLATPVLPVIEALLRTMRRLYADRGVTFALGDQAQGLAFRGEEQDLYELIGNLVDNAGKWTCSYVQIDVQRDGTQLRISVDDDGPGVPAEQRQQLFTRGVQLDEQRPGCGLGLDIVRTLANTYGGRIEVMASPLGGAQFMLWLPMAD
jgi:signal transduction histidine kinase